MDEFDFSTNKTRISKIQKIKIICLSFVYIFLIAIISYISKNQIQIVLFSTVFSPSVLSGVLTSLGVAVGIIITQVHWYFGGIICNSLFSVSLFFCVVNIFISKHAESTPGIFFLLSGYLINVVLIKNLKTIQNKNLIVKKASVTDPVTGLLNHRGITQEINLLITLEKPFYVLFLDMDNFKALNDTCGHSAGDFFLTAMGKRWTSIPKPAGKIARNGGDEYIIVIPSEKPFDIEGYARQCVLKASEPVSLPKNKGNFSSSASIGIAKYPEDGNTLDEIIAKADSAMYNSKHNGKNCYTFCNR